METEPSATWAASAAPQVTLYGHARTARPSAGGDRHHALGVTATQSRRKRV